MSYISETAANCAGILERGARRMAEAAQGEVTFEGSQDFRLSFGTSGSGDAITVGRKYRVTIEEVAE